MNEPLGRRLRVVTPEQIRLDYETAGIGSRAGAHLIDGAILLGFYLFLFGAAAAAGSGEAWSIAGGQYAWAAAVAAAFLVQYGYFWLSEFYMGGRTIGKKAVGLRVIQDNGQSLTFLSAALRNFFRVLDMLPVGYLVGMAVCFFHPLDKRLGDMVAGTVVVFEEGRQISRKRRRIEKALAGWIVPPLDLSEEQRRRISREDWSMLEAWIERLPDLPPARQEVLGARLAKHLRDRLEGASAGADGRSGSGGSAEFLIGLYRAIRDEWEMP